MKEPYHLKSLIILLIALMVCYSGMLIIKTVPDGDETISYLCAAGNQTTYEKVLTHELFYKQLLPVDSLQALFQPKQKLFQSISQGLVESDIHPPLYFWLLHLLLLSGIPLMLAGLLLNFIFHAGTLTIWFWYLKKKNIPPSIGFVMLIMLIFSSAIADTAFVARQYMLLLFLFSGFYITWNLILTKPNLGLWIVYILFITFGMLTHYLFWYVLPFTLLYSVWQQSVKQSIYLTFCLVIAFLLFYTIHPDFWIQFNAQQTRAQPYQTKQLLERFLKIILSFIQLFFPVWWIKEGMKNIFAIIGLVWIVAVIVFLKSKIKKIRIHLAFFNKPELAMLMYLLGLHILPYLLFFTPYHATGRYYWVMSMPLIFLITAKCISEIKFITKLLLLLVSLSVWFADTHQKEQQKQEFADSLEAYKEITVTTLNRRGFLRFVPMINNKLILLAEHPMQPKKNQLWITDEFTLKHLPFTPVDIKTYSFSDGVTLYRIITP